MSSASAVKPGLRGMVRAALPVLVILIAGILLWHSLSELVFTATRRRLGPDVWPRLVLLLLALGCLWRLGELALARGDAGPPLAQAVAGRPFDMPDQVLATPARLVPALAGLSILALYVAALPVLGFTLASLLLMAGVMWTSGLRRLRILVPTACFGSFGFFIVFQKLVYLSLPLGIGPFRELSLQLMALSGVR